MFGQASRITIYAGSLREAEQKLATFKSKPSKMEHVLFGQPWKWTCTSEKDGRFVFEKE